MVVILSGRYAGKKAVIVKNYDEGTESRPYGHAIVAGIEKYPLKITKSMGQKKVAQRSRVHPFVKVVNYSHMMSTRYSLDVDLKAVVTVDNVKDVTQRADAKKKVRDMFEEKYKAGKNKWFFEKLRF